MFVTLSFVFSPSCSTLKTSSAFRLFSYYYIAFGLLYWLYCLQAYLFCLQARLLPSPSGCSIAFKRGYYLQAPLLRRNRIVLLFQDISEQGGNTFSKNFQKIFKKYAKNFQKFSKKFQIKFKKFSLIFKKKL